MNYAGYFTYLYFLLLIFACSDSQSKSETNFSVVPAVNSESPVQPEFKKLADLKTIHVFVALCDNKYQGIVPVPAKIGNGQDASSNLYWGAAFGVKTFFKKSNDWDLKKSIKNPQEYILERLVFRHKTKNIYLLADAYDGQYIKHTTIDFLLSCSGNYVVTISENEKSIPFGGNADVLAYIGHDGLMDFSINESFTKQNDAERNAIILSCISKKYFSDHLAQTGAIPLLWTTGLMAPEAYILHAALNKWIETGKPEQVRIAGAEAYSKYQRCSITAAKKLLVTGW